jgi:hypothetical protein
MRSCFTCMLIIAFVGIATVSPAKTQDYPVCLLGGSSDQMQCDFVSVEQCRAMASGGLGYCASNPAIGFASVGRDRSASRSR